jgi:hypothetical protein
MHGLAVVGVVDERISSTLTDDQRRSRKDRSDGDSNRDAFHVERFLLGDQLDGVSGNDYRSVGPARPSRKSQGGKSVQDYSFRAALESP